MKHELHIEYEIGFDLIGISTYLPDYRLTWLINTLFSLKLSRTDDVTVEPSGKDKGSPLFDDTLESGRFATYSFLTDDHSEEVRLIANRQNGFTLLSNYPRVDFFLRIDSSEHSTDDYLNALSARTEVMAARQVEIGQMNDDIHILYSNE